MVSKTLLLAALLVLTLACPVGAGPPAAIPASGRERASRAFDSFAEEWMAKMERAERNNRSQPKLKTVGSQQQFTYRGYASDFETELKPTGHPSAPYVGVLRYREHLYACTDRAARTCSVAAQTPVTEIFRFQNGRWVY